ncbi:MAG: hypothetical protein IPK61_03780 [Saprospiraceae bacterium]|nr:hypothetical protein [Saprospiraceae bacterium]
MRNEIIRFLILFGFCYAFCILLFQNAAVYKSLNAKLRVAITALDKSFFSKAEISSQDVYDDQNKKDHNRMYIVFGNPKTIKIEMENARRQGLNEVRISTYSAQFYFFQMIYAPLAFLLSLFVGTKMPWKKMMKGLAYSILIFTLYKFVSFIVSAMSIGFSMVLCFCLWLIFGLRHSSFYQFLQSIFSQISK